MLEVEHLKIAFNSNGSVFEAVHGASFGVGEGESVAMSAKAARAKQFRR